MAPRAVRLAGAAIGVIAGSLALNAPAAFAKGPPPTVSASASSSCLVTATASFWKNLTVTSITWTLDKNGTIVAGGDTADLGVLSSPQSTAASNLVGGGWTLTTSASTNAFSVTAQLWDGATPVGSATSKTITANCA
jgi:hypothetical protein